MAVTDTVRAAAEPVVGSLGLELWDVSFVKEGSEYVLRIYIDKAEGVSINDCEEVSRIMNPILDELDPIEQAYSFEVMSAGLVRELKTEEQIRRFLNKTVEIRLFKSDDAIVPKTKRFDALLTAVDTDTVTVDIKGVEKQIPRKAVAKIIIDLV